MLHIVHAEQFLEAHTADTGNSIQAGQSQSGNAHGHKDGSNINGHAEHLKETGNAAAEDLERGASSGGTVSSSGCTGNAEGQNSQQAFQHHSTVTNLQHILFAFNRLGRSTGGNQTVEAGNSTASHGNEQNGEHGAQFFVIETGKDGQVHGGMCNQQANNSTGNHADEHEGGHVVAGLLQQPHGQNCSKENVNKGDVAPGSLVKNQGEFHADSKGQHDEHDAQNSLFPAGEVKLLLDQAKHNSEQHEHDGNHAGCAVGGSCISQAGNAVNRGVSVKSTGNHISKSCNNDAAEQPAEQQEQLAAQLADVLFDQHAHGLAVVLNGSIQSAEVGNSAKENAADEHPQQNRQPAEGCSLDCTGNRACTGNGRKLMAENGPAVGGNVILTVVILNSGGLCVRVNAPGFCHPAPIKRISTDKNHSSDQHDDECVHDNPSLR